MHYAAIAVFSVVSEDRLANSCRTRALTLLGLGSLAPPRRSLVDPETSPQKVHSPPLQLNVWRVAMVIGNARGVRQSQLLHVDVAAR